MDYLYLLLIAAVMFSVVVQFKVSSTFKKYSRVPAGRGHTAAEMARRILDSHGLYHVRVERVGGHLSDHFDPRTNVLRLSDSVYSSSSASAVGVAAHEVGHAIQHAEGYAPITVRGKLVPAVNFASRFSWLAILLGFFMISVSEITGKYVLILGIGLFAVTTLFHLVTLPCETNASKRAMCELENCGWYTREELSAAKSVLSAAAMTYIAALAVSAIQLLRLIRIVRND
jgi:Zn-dependent membrane protease YugP